MWNASDVVAMAAIAAGAAGSVALYSALSERSGEEVRTIVVEELRGPALDPPVQLRFHRLDPPPALPPIPPPGELRIQHVPYVVIERVERRVDGETRSLEVDGRRFLLQRDGKAIELRDGRAIEIEKRRRHPHPDRKRKRRPRDRP